MSSLGQMGGTVPDCFEQAKFIQIEAVDPVHCVQAAKIIREVFHTSIQDCMKWVRDSHKPFTIPLGPYEIQEAELIASILRENYLTVSLVDSMESPSLPPPRTSWERILEDDE